ncbi:hypothetical protein [Stenotrophomonas oahuensis]|uniref:Uncharacterized protein n=1 Tax=Stenotrophomonas oahuensis TaxID=3003271 RepID=A0ABY9YXC3_9GAMM|nr:hypothetical protein [Stenotrophomonas sp. A5586]WNH54803.1 hypothetical protein PDM29_20885 [Stenotrophomonas sp. A5586]
MSNTSESVKFILVEVYDLSQEYAVDEEGDYSWLVTVRIEGGTVADVLDGAHFDELAPSGVKVASRIKLPDHVEFSTFCSKDAVRRFFGEALPKTEHEMQFDRLYRSVDVLTVGQLRQALAGLPDEMPVIHTAEMLDSGLRTNRIGLSVQSGEWAYDEPGKPSYDDTRWCLRVAEVWDHRWHSLPTPTNDATQTAGLP